MAETKLKYKRVMLKLSGEALAYEDGKGYNNDEITNVAKQVKTLRNKGVDVCVVTGGGNYWRGATGTGIERTKSDSIGMLATVMNAVYVSEIFRLNGMDTAILTTLPFANITEMYSKDLANKYFKEGKVIFFAAGTGHPYFTTDTGMALRAIESNCDLILAAKSIDGVYDSDPEKNPDAKKYKTISYSEVVEKKLGVIDLTASTMLEQNAIEMRIFSLYEKNSIQNALGTKFNGTKVTIKKK